MTNEFINKIQSSVAIGVSLDKWPQWVLFDLDGTLCDTKHREHYALARDWDNFHAGIPFDQPHIAELIILLALFNSHLRIGLATARFEAHRASTEDWLNRHRIPFHELQMRKDGDYRSGTEVKKEMFTDGRHVLCVFEDSDSVVKMWREERGLTCFHCRPGAY